MLWVSCLGFKVQTSGGAGCGGASVGTIGTGAEVHLSKGRGLGCGGVGGVLPHIRC